MTYIKNPSFTGMEYWEDDSDQGNHAWPDMDHPYHPKSLRDRIAKTTVGGAMQMYAEEREADNQNMGDIDGEYAAEVRLVDSARSRLAQLVNNGVLLLDKNGDVCFADFISPQELQGARQALIDLTTLYGQRRFGIGKVLISEIDHLLRHKENKREVLKAEEKSARIELTERKDLSPEKAVRCLAQLACNLKYFKKLPKLSPKGEGPTTLRENIRGETEKALNLLSYLREHDPDKLLEIIVQHDEFLSRLDRGIETYDPDLSFDLNAYKRVLICYLQTHEIRFSERVLQEFGINYRATLDARYEIRRGEKTFAQIIRENNSRLEKRKDDPQAFLKAMTSLKTKKRRPATRHRGPEVKWKNRHNIQAGSGNQTYQMT